MDSKPNTGWPPETAEQREQRLAALSPQDRELVLSVMTNHPGTTAEQIIEQLRNAGGALMSGALGRVGASPNCRHATARIIRR